MNNYESVLILKSDISNERKEETINIFLTFLNKDGTVTNVEDLGLKKLAYEVQKYKEGNYIVIEFKTEPSNILELERLFRITDNVLKFITVRKDEI